MTDALELWLMRHGETLWNREGRVQGQSDSPLTDLGILQAERLAERLQGNSFDAIYSSDAKRAQHTAQIVLPQLSGEKLALTLEPRLRELDFGMLEGKFWQKMQGEDKEALDAWLDDPYSVRLPQGESYQDLEARVVAWFKQLPKQGRIAVFAHGGSIRSLLYHITGRPQANSWRFYLENTSISKIAVGLLGTIVLTVNDCAHLEQL